MKESIYKAARLNIFEKHREGLITESQRDELFTILEKEKEDSELTPAKATDLLDEMKEKFPEAEKEIDKVLKKLDKSDGDEGGDDSEKDKDDSDSKDASTDTDDSSGEEVSEAYTDLLNQINSL